MGLLQVARQVKDIIRTDFAITVYIVKHKTKLLLLLDITRDELVQMLPMLFISIKSREFKDLHDDIDLSLVVSLLKKCLNVSTGHLDVFQLQLRGRILVGQASKHVLIKLPDGRIFLINRLVGILHIVNLVEGIDLFSYRHFIENYLFLRA